MSRNLDQEKHGRSEAPVQDLFLRRWSPRAFAETPIDLDTLKGIFSAGQWAASSFNEQPWRFVVGRKSDPVWQQIFESLAPANQSWTKSAPVLFASFAKKHSAKLAF
jgi:nitroreductase